jgi:acyl dehydratase
VNEYKLSELTVGLGHNFNVIVTDIMMVKFLEISSDTNPLHTNSEYALSKGFETPVVYGMLTASFYSTLVGVYLPGKYCILQSIDMQFTKPVFVGDELTISGKIKSIHENFKQIEIKADIINQDGQKISRATIKTGVIDE